MREPKCGPGVGSGRRPSPVSRQFTVAFEAGHSFQFNASTYDVLHAYAMTVHRYHGCGAASGLRGAQVRASDRWMGGTGGA